MLCDKMQEEKIRFDKKLSDERKLRQDAELELERARSNLHGKNAELAAVS